MEEQQKSEVKKVRRHATTKEPQLPRDPNLTGGERAETAHEREARLKEQRKPKEPPIIQKDVT